MDDEASDSSPALGVNISPLGRSRSSSNSSFLDRWHGGDVPLGDVSLIEFQARLRTPARSLRRFFSLLPPPPLTEREDSAAEEMMDAVDGDEDEQTPEEVLGLSRRDIEYLDVRRARRFTRSRSNSPDTGEELGVAVVYEMPPDLEPDPIPSELAHRRSLTTPQSGFIRRRPLRRIFPVNEVDRLRAGRMLDRSRTRSRSRSRSPVVVLEDDAQDDMGEHGVEIVGLFRRDIEDLAVRQARQRRFTRSRSNSPDTGDDIAGAVTYEMPPDLEPDPIPSELAHRRRLINAQIFPLLPNASVSQAHVKAEERCAICIDIFAIVDERVAKLGCQHIFHTECIIPWMEDHLSCPVCRAEITVGFFV